MANRKANEAGKLAGAFDPLAEILGTYCPWSIALLSSLEKAVLQLELAIWYIGKTIATRVFELINDPWAPSEIWYPILWIACYRTVLKTIYCVSTIVKRQVFGVRKRILAVFSRELAESEAPKADNFEDSFWGWLRTPMRNLGIVWLVSYICDQFQLVMAHGGVDPEQLSAMSPWLRSFDTLVYIFWGASLLLNIKDRYLPRICVRFRRTRSRSKYQNQVMVLDKMISLVIIVFTVGIALQAVGLRAQALFVSSLGGLAISFASKDILANFVSGILIISQGRCEVGEVARFGDISGQVVKVGWLMTDVRESSTLALVSVPNANIMSSGVSIETFNTHRKVKQRFTIPYDAVDKVESIIADVQQAYQEIEYVDTFPNLGPSDVRSPYYRPRVGVEELKSNGLVILLAYLVGPVKSRGTQGGTLESKVRTQVTLRVARILQKHGVRVAPEEIAITGVRGGGSSPISLVQGPAVALNGGGHDGEAVVHDAMQAGPVQDRLH